MASPERLISFGVGNDPSRKLWLEVVLRAQEEAAGRYRYGKEPKIVQYLAQRWLTTYSRSLNEVCEFAGFTDLMVRKLVEGERAKWRLT